MFSLWELNHVMKNVLKEVAFEENSSSSYFEILMAKDEPSIHDHVLLLFVQIKKRGKHPWRSVSISQVPGFSLQLYQK